MLLLKRIRNHWHSELHSCTQCLLSYFCLRESTVSVFLYFYGGVRHCTTIWHINCTLCCPVAVLIVFYGCAGTLVTVNWVKKMRLPWQLIIWVYALVLCSNHLSWKSCSPLIYQSSCEIMSIFLYLNLYHSCKRYSMETDEWTTWIYLKASKHYFILDVH